AGLEGKCEECSNLAVQRSARNSQDTARSPNSALAIVDEVLRSPGRPLDAETRALFEPRFGHDFSRVRVHTGERAAASARAVNAWAYTVGEHVVFGERQYAPHASAGQRLLAHELTHAVQQTGSSRLTSGAPQVGESNDIYEQEADVVANQVLAARPQSV